MFKNANLVHICHNNEHFSVRFVQGQETMYCLCASINVDSSE